jgi:hypothetical protein
LNLTPHMHRFRYSSRDVWNHYFMPWATEDPPSDALCGFQSVEEALFLNLVLDPAGLDGIRYRLEHPRIRVVIDSAYPIPAMVNRAEDSGYWDYPVVTLDRRADLRFVAYFDWNQQGLRDNQYVRAVIRGHSMAELLGKHVLLDANYLLFETVA